MKRPLALIALLLPLWIGAEAHATLFDRGGGLIYDDVLDVTWLQNTNYGAYSVYEDTGGDPPGSGNMTGYNALAFVADLEYYDSVRNITWTDWRLPKALPVNGSSYTGKYETGAFDGSRDKGFNISAPGSAYPESTASELAYMYYVNLGNLGQYDVDGNEYPGWDPNSYNASFESGGPGGAVTAFQNLYSVYWTSAVTPEDASERYGFNIWTGNQTNWDHSASVHRAWAVRDGDVGAPVPEPGTLILLGSGLVGFAGTRIRRKHKKC